MADANPCRMEGRMTECNAMKRPGKPDTGNPFVRFDEGRSGDTELTTMVCLICYSPLRLLYQRESALYRTYVEFFSRVQDARELRNVLSRVLPGITRRPF